MRIEIWILEKNGIFGLQGLVQGLDVFFWKTKDETKNKCEAVNSLLSKENYTLIKNLLYNKYKPIV